MRIYLCCLIESATKVGVTKNGLTRIVEVQCKNKDGKSSP